MNKYKDLISLSHAAKAFGLSPTSLRIYVLRGRLQAVKMGRNWMTTKKEVERYLSGRAQGKKKTRR